MTESTGDLSPSTQLTTSELSRLVTDIDAALPRVHRYAPATPLLRLPILDSLIKGEALLKAECLQATGSFKVRGALNVMTQLASDERERRVIAFSSGNHGIGVAYAARCLGMQATIVVPDDAPLAKIDRIRCLGAETVFYDRLTEDREQVATALRAKYPAPLVKPYDDWHTIAGQGTYRYRNHMHGRWRSGRRDRNLSQSTVLRYAHHDRGTRGLARPLPLI